jgi:hypothetical protein
MTELNRDQLLDIARSTKNSGGCTECTPLSCAGWESVPGSFELNKLQIIGTLRIEGAEEIWDEYHPDGTNIWSKGAPISIKHHPYNRSDVYECISCKRKFLRYTEYGGYYVDERIRELDQNLIS